MDFKLCFNSESEILKSISHPKVPSFINSFEVDGMYCLIQEYIEGYPLSYYISGGCRYSENEVKEILLQVLVILTDLHCPAFDKTPIIHRDLRLSNLLLNNNELFLIDFGFARFLNSQSMIIPNNVFPEVLDGNTYRLLRKEVSPRSDLFGLGVVALDLFTNWVEDEALSKQSWEKVLPISKGFAKYIKRLLSYDNSFTCAEDALLALKNI